MKYIKLLPLLLLSLLIVSSVSAVVYDITEAAYTQKADPTKNYNSGTLRGGQGITGQENLRSWMFVNASFDSNDRIFFNPSRSSSDGCGTETVKLYYCNSDGSNFDETTLTWNNLATQTDSCSPANYYNHAHALHKTGYYYSPAEISYSSMKNDADGKFFIMMETSGPDCSFVDYYSDSTSAPPKFVVMEDTPGELVNGLMSYYNFEDTQFYDVTYQRSQPVDYSMTQESGKRQYGIGNDGTMNQYLDTLWDGVTDHNFTIGLWFKTYSVGTHYLLSNVHASAGLMIRTSGASITSTMYGSPSDTLLAPYNNNEWYYVMVTYNADTNNFSMYLNNTLVDSGTTTFTPNTGDDMTIGALSSGDTASWSMDAVVDEVGIWERILTEEEMTFLYNDGYGVTYDEILAAEAGPPPPPSFNWENNIFGYELEETGFDYVDEEGNQNLTTGTIPDREDGVIGFGQRFDKSSTEYLSTGINTQFRVSNPYMCAWINYSETDDTQIFLSTYPNSGALTSGFYLSTNNIDELYVVYYGNGAGNYDQLRYIGNPLVEGTVYHICSNFESATGDPNLYIDGVKVAATLEKDDTSSIFWSYSNNFYVGELQQYEGTYGSNSMIDQVIYGNGYFDEEQASLLYNEGAGIAYGYVPVSQPEINISFDIGLESDQTINNHYYFNGSNNGAVGIECNAFVNNVSGNLDTCQDVNVSLGQFNTGESFSYNYTCAGASAVEAEFEIGFLCYNSTLNESSSISSTAYFDMVNPLIGDENSINNTVLRFNEPLVGTFEFQDQFLYNYKYYLDGALQEDVNISGTNYYLNISENFGTSSGTHNMTLIVADGHTKNKIKQYENNIYDDVDKSLWYTLDNGEKLEIKPKNKNDFDYAFTFYAEDRYPFIFSKKDVDQDIIEFTVKTNDDSAVYLPNSHFPGHIILPSTSNWLDFDVKDIDDEVVSVEELGNGMFKVTVIGVAGMKDVIFQSLGELNLITEHYFFEVINVTTSSSYNSPIAYVNTGNFELNITYENGSLGSTSSALLVYNDSGSFLSVNADLANRDFNNGFWTDTYTASVLPTKPSGEFIDNGFYWNYSIGTTYFDTNLSYQRVYDVDIGTCSGSVKYPLLYVEHRDEVSEGLIDLDDTYSLTFTSGVFSEVISDGINDENNFTICTNINDSIAELDFNIIGSFALTKDSYASRNYQYLSADPLTANNSGTGTNHTLFLVPLNASQTVTYNWLDTNYKGVNGLMRIYSCDGTERTLIETSPVSNGLTTANIQLYTKSYAYDIIVNDEVFTLDGFSGFSTFNTCHVESSTALTYYIDVDNDLITPYYDLYSVPCTLSKISENNTHAVINMTWGATTGNDTLTGCIEGWYYDISGSTKFYEDCTSTSTTLLKSINFDGNSYRITGKITQGSDGFYCQDEINVFVNKQGTEIFGVEGLVAVAFLIISMMLFFASDGVMQLLGVGIGIIASFWLGIIFFSWEQVMFIVIILVGAVLIGRYNRK